MRYTMIALLAALAAPAAVAQAAPAGQAAAAAKYTTADTPISTLLEDPAAKAVLMKIIPEMAGNEQFAQAGGLTLKAVAGYTNGALSDEKLAEIDAELAKIK